MGALLHRHGSYVAACAAVLCLYLAALRSMPLDVFWHPDDGAKFLGLLSIQWDHGLKYAVPYPGRVHDPQLRYYPGNCGEHGSLYPLAEAGGAMRFRWSTWFLLLVRPFLDAFGIAGIYIVPLLGGWLTAVVAGRWAAAYDVALAPLATLVVGVATPITFYSVSFSEHAVATLCAALATSLFVCSRRAWAGWCTAALSAIAVVLRIEMLAFVGALLVAWGVSAWAERRHAASGALVGERRSVRRLRWVHAAVAVGVLVGAAVLTQGLAPRHLELLMTVPYMLQRGLAKVPYLGHGLVGVFMGFPDLPDPFGGVVWKREGFLILSAAAAAGLVRTRWMEAILMVVVLLCLLECAVVTAVLSNTYLDRPGVLMVAPYMFAGVYVLPYAWRQPDGGFLRLASIGVGYTLLGFLTLFVAKMSEDGGYLIGLDGSVRYMLSFYPIGAVLSLMSVQVVRASDRPALFKSLFTVLVVAMMLVSVVFQFRGLQMLREKRQTLVAWEQALQRQDRVVTDIWWLAASMAPFFAAHEMYCVRTPDEVSAWIALAAGQGVSAFSIASLRVVGREDLGPAAANVVADGSEVVRDMHIYRYRMVPAGD